MLQARLVSITAANPSTVSSTGVDLSDVCEVEGHTLEVQPFKARLQFPLDALAIESRPIDTVGVAFRRIAHIDAKSERLVKRGERRLPVESAEP